VVVRVFSAPYGPGMFPVPQLQGCLFLTLFLQGLQNLLDRIERMRALGPGFIDITWYALPLSSLVSSFDFRL